MTVRFRDIIAPENYKAFRRHFFRIHFQFVMANEQPNAYDFFMMVCGPVSLRDRADHPAAALAIAVGDSDVRHDAWRQLEATSANVATPNCDTPRQPLCRSCQACHAISSALGDRDCLSLKKPPAPCGAGRELGYLPEFEPFSA